MFIFKQHNTQKFEQYTPLVGKDKREIGFRIEDKSPFLFDDEQGWMDRNGCYFDHDGKPAGWISLSKDHLHYELYDMDKQFVLQGENYYYSYNLKDFDPLVNGKPTAPESLSKKSSSKAPEPLSKRTSDKQPKLSKGVSEEPPKEAEKQKEPRKKKSKKQRDESKPSDHQEKDEPRQKKNEIYIVKGASQEVQNQQQQLEKSEAQVPQQSQEGSEQSRQPSQYQGRKYKKNRQSDRQDGQKQENIPEKEGKPSSKLEQTEENVDEQPRQQKQDTNRRQPRDDKYQGKGKYNNRSKNQGEDDRKEGTGDRFYILDILGIDQSVQEQTLIDYLIQATKLSRNAFLNVVLPKADLKIGQLHINTAHALLKVYRISGQIIGEMPLLLSL